MPAYPARSSDPCARTSACSPDPCSQTRPYSGGATHRTPGPAPPIRLCTQARRALGTELAAHRRAAGHSQAALASLVNYSRSTIANVEVGRQHVPRRFWEHAECPEAAHAATACAACC
ncbi:MAG: helix-turn-helix domain-containing protein [Trebonia sp.]